MPTAKNNRQLQSSLPHNTQAKNPPGPQPLQEKFYNNAENQRQAATSVTEIGVNVWANDEEEENQFQAQPVTECFP